MTPICTIRAKATGLRVIVHSPSYRSTEKATEEFWVARMYLPFGKLRVSINNFVKVYDRYAALNKARVVCTTPQQKELMYIKLLRAYLSLLRRLN